MKKILLLAALEDEFGAEGARRLSESCDVRFTGVGKLRAFEATLKALSGGDYDAVLNAGTCGSLRHATGTVLRPSVIVQGDIYVDSIFATPPEFAARGDEGVSIVSSDDFIGPDTAAERRASAGRYDCFDMESYAIARRAFLRRRTRREVARVGVPEAGERQCRRRRRGVERAYRKAASRAGRGDRGGRKGVVVDDGEPNID